MTQLQPDILHALHLTSYGFLAATCQARPRLASVWGTDILEAPTWSPVHNAITRYALLKADHITATGFRLASATLPYAPRSKPITVTPYGVDTTRFHGSDERQSRGEAVIGSVGRLSKRRASAVCFERLPNSLNIRRNYASSLPEMAPSALALNRWQLSWGSEQTSNSGAMSRMMTYPHFSTSWISSLCRHWPRASA